MKVVPVQSRRLLAIAIVLTTGILGLAELAKTATLNPPTSSDYHSIFSTVLTGGNERDGQISGPIKIIDLDEENSPNLSEPTTSIGVLWVGVVGVRFLLKRTQQAKVN